MDSAILKTLIYSDLFDFPLKPYEIQKWLIGEKASLRQVEEGLQVLLKSKKINYKHGFYFLKGRQVLVSRRTKRQVQSERLWKKAQQIGWLLKAIPWIKLVGVSGTLSMDNASRSDDIDLFVITKDQRVWLARAAILSLLELRGVRRRPQDSKRSAAGKVCVNILIDEANLVQPKKDLYVAHEVLQMRVLWQRGRTYAKFLGENCWVFTYLPNWIASVKGMTVPIKKDKASLSRSGSFLDAQAKKWQQRIMKEPVGDEQIEQGRLYFHPVDIGREVMREYTKRIKRARLD